MLNELIANRAGRDDLLPPVGMLARYRALEVAQVVAAGPHVDFGPLFGEPGDPDLARNRVAGRLERLTRTRGDEFLPTGTIFAFADAYAGNIPAWWTPEMGLDLTRWPALRSYRGRPLARRSSIAAERRTADAACGITEALAA